MWHTSLSGRLDSLSVFKAVSGDYIPAGELTFEGKGSVRSGRFRYAQSYLETMGATPIDPVGLPLGRKQHVCAPAPGHTAECNPQTAFASYLAFGL